MSSRHKKRPTWRWGLWCLVTCPRVSHHSFCPLAHLSSTPPDRALRGWKEPLNCPSFLWEETNTCFTTDRACSWSTLSASGTTGYCEPSGRKLNLQCCWCYRGKQLHHWSLDQFDSKYFNTDFQRKPFQRAPFPHEWWEWIHCMCSRMVWKERWNFCSYSCELKYKRCHLSKSTGPSAFGSTVSQRKVRTWSRIPTIPHSKWNMNKPVGMQEVRTHLDDAKLANDECFSTQTP